MKVRALCWVNCGGWHRAGEVFDVEDHSALPGLVETVEEEKMAVADRRYRDEETDSSAPAEASAQNDRGGTEDPSPTEELRKTAKKRGRKA